MAYSIDTLRSAANVATRIEAANGTGMPNQIGVDAPAAGPIPQWSALATSFGSADAASGDDADRDIRLDQYYTRSDVAERFYAVFREHHDPHLFQMVEPSAGTGAFFGLMPAGSLAYDVDPRFPGIEAADFLTVDIESDRSIAMLGNPPFGRNASLAVRFFNHAARQSDVIALILPRTFRKASIENRIDRAFHLVREEPVPAHAFLFRSKPYNVPAVFQVWNRRETPRPKRPAETRHPDFEFTTPDRADFVIQRVGARAGRVHHDFGMSPSSHLFIKGDVEPVMRKLDLARVAADVAGNPSISKAEIVSLYQAWIGARRRRPHIRTHSSPGTPKVSRTNIA